MLVVSAKITTTPGKRDAFIAAAQPCIAATRQEAGCRKYELYAATENPDSLMYFELWESRAALDAHLASPHMAAFAKVKEERNLQIGAAELALFNTTD